MIFASDLPMGAHHNAIGGLDFDIGLLVNLRSFFEEQCIASLRFLERGGALMHKHFQMLVKGNFNSLLVLNKKN